MPVRSVYPTAVPFLPERRTLPSLERAVQGCRGCPLYARATQAVFGQGPVGAGLMLVGEQPGDHEEGPVSRSSARPAAFSTGPGRGRGSSGKKVYVTNAVKHFKWKERGPRRIHEKPTWTENVACRPWLEAELALVRPRALVLLGATAAQSLLGRDSGSPRSRGEPLESDLAELVLATIHPSAVLRADDQEAAFAGLVDDLRPVGGCVVKPDPRRLLGVELRPLAKRGLLPAQASCA